MRRRFERLTGACSKRLQREFPHITGDAMEMLGREFSRDTHAVLLPYVLSKLNEYSDANLVKMARSFSFGNCEPGKPMVELLSKHARGGTA